MAADNQSTRPRVLVIDDEDATRHVFRRILNRAGFEVEEAATGHEGLAKAMTVPDVIICDVTLPDILGYDVSRRLKSNPLTQSIPVLQISASFLSDESKVQTLEGGADSYLTQPIEPAVLVTQTNALIRLRRAESQSHLSVMQWQSTFDALSDGLALADADGYVVRANGAFAEMLGIPPSAVKGESLAATFESHFGTSMMRFLLEHPQGQSAELPAGDRWFRVRYDTIQSDPLTTSGSILIVTDITDHKKLQETLKLSERLTATGRLAHIIAHEINNPLEAMANLLYLAEQNAAEDTRIYIRQAASELARISQITKQVLAYHRESKLPVATKADELIDSVLAIFKAHIASVGVTLSAEIRCDSLLMVHPGEIRQVFSNLISNALDAIDSSDAKLRVRCVACLDARTMLPGVRFIFSDNGSGIAERVLPHIYDAFYTTKESRGSGIGLWLSAEVVGKHGGHMRVRTRTEGPYRGTLFDVLLPS